MILTTYFILEMQNISFSESKSSVSLSEYQILEKELKATIEEKERMHIQLIKVQHDLDSVIDIISGLEPEIDTNDNFCNSPNQKSCDYLDQNEYKEQIRPDNGQDFDKTQRPTNFAKFDELGYVNRSKLPQIDNLVETVWKLVEKFREALNAKDHDSDISLENRDKIDFAISDIRHEYTKGN